ncbi:alpha/beta hydrolase fold domain-containing protein [Paenibacillus sp. M1]|uniref:Alpha/beta hydrolase fold domain-containing protein n=1 Tax=Paenibacillus haidiansis TaxID=1574488 RepID=A0ABU7VNK4_9BACL
MKRRYIYIFFVILIGAVVLGVWSLMGRVPDENTSAVKAPAVPAVADRAHNDLKYLTPAYEVNVHHDIVYASKRNETETEEPLKLDLYEPQGGEGESKPVFLFIHGGGYTEGSKSDAADISMRLASLGYAVVSMDYRLKSVPFADFAHTLGDAYEDISDAIGWIRHNAAELNLDASRIAIGGDSAGGYLALNFTNEYLERDPSKVQPIFAIVDIYGGMPENRVHGQLPPVLIIHGTIDTMIPYRQSLDLEAALEESGIYHNMLTMEGAGHDYKNADYFDEVVETISHFLWNVMSAPDVEWLPDNAGTAVAAGDPLDLVLPEGYIRSSAEEPLAIAMPEGWTLDDPGDGQTIRVRVPAGIEPGNYTVAVSIDKGTDDPAVGFAVNVKVISPLRETYETYYDAADGVIKTRLHITNQSSNPMDGSLVVNYGTEQGASGIFETSVNALEPGGGATYVIPELAAGKRELRAFDKTGSLLQTSEDDANALILRPSGNPLQIDGDLRDWGGTASFPITDVKMDDWKGAEDAGATGYLSWDTDRLYLALEVTDDTHSQSAAGNELWRGDSIQVAVGIAEEDGGTPSEYHEMGFALGDDGQMSRWRWIAPGGFLAGEFLSSDFAAARRDNATVYEAAIPWSELIADRTLAGPGLKLKFSLLVNDNDGAGRKGWLEYNGGIGTAKDINAFGDIFLAE